MMEDDDEFGDLYTDVLRPFSTTSQPQPGELDQTDAVAPTAAPSTTTPSRSRPPIDLNNNSIDSDDDEILFGAPNSNSNPKIDINTNKDISSSNKDNLGSSLQLETLASQPDFQKRPDPVNEMEGLAGELDLGASGLDKREDAKLQKPPTRGLDLMDEDDVHVVVEEREDKDANLVARNENNGADASADEATMIPGVTAVIPGVSGGVDVGANEDFDEYDSDSDDDLRIVLNNDNELGAMGMQGMGGMEDDEDDEDEDPLVIVADNDNLAHQPMMEDQEWGEEAGTGVGPDGERKDLGDSGKVNGGAVLPPKIYNSHPYHHPFHSQFKYVRPGISPTPGAGPVGPGGNPGQVRPPVNVGPLAGRGRGDWRPAGRGGLPMQKGFHPGYGMPGWGSNTSGRGLEFTLPSHKTIFEVDIDSFEEKPWKLPGVDVSDFFNFGLIEESWKEYCKQLEQHRLETTMQSRIRVYESGRTEQEYDPDLPPELAAASGIQHPENADVAKMNAGQNDLSKGSVHARPPLPTGRPILVETNYTERLPSIDTRQPRIRDSDAIIEIICQDCGADENDMEKKQDDGVSKDELRQSEEIEDHSEGSAERVDDYDNRKKEFIGRKKQVVNPTHGSRSAEDKPLPVSSAASIQCRPGSREQTPVYSASNSSGVNKERTMKGKMDRGSPEMATSQSTRDKDFIDNKKEGESSESIDDKPRPSSSGTAEEENVEKKGTKSMGREDMAVDMTAIQDDMIKDENLKPSFKKQKLNSRAGHVSPDIDDREDSKVARSSENSKARSGGSKDYRKPRDGTEEEVVQGERSMHMANIRRSSGRDEDAIRRKGRDERQETDRHRASAKGKEDPYSHKGWDPNSGNQSRVRTDIPDRRRENDNERAWQRIDEDLYAKRARVESTRKREHTDEIGPRHLSNTRETERSRKHEHHHLKEHLDSGSWRGNHDKDILSKHRDREDSLKIRDESVDNLHSKRRKEETLMRREQAEREEILHGHREQSSRRKRERDDILDQRKRDDPRRLRDDDLYNARHKEEGLLQRDRGERQRDRDEWHRSKNPHEEILSKRERDEGRGGLRTLRTGEDKAWANQSRGKEEYRGSDRDYHVKDVGRHSEQPKRKDRVENETLTQRRGREDAHAWGNQGNIERKPKHERISARDDSAANDTENHRVHEKKQKDLRKAKQSDDQKPVGLYKRNQDEHSGQPNEAASSKGKLELGSSENEIRVKHQQPSSKHTEKVSSDDEQSHSRRGRSKLERWASHKEKDVAIRTKPSSLQIKESSAPSQGSKLSDEPTKPVEDECRPAKDRDAAPDTTNADTKLVENKQLDTVEKLKKRSERFKLPMPSEKETTTTKKTEQEPLPSTQNETRQDTVIKSERPARKRRWTSN